MTDTCATCRYYVHGECRLEPYPIRKVDPSFWCGEFSSGTPGIASPNVAISIATVDLGSGSFDVALFIMKSDNTLWLSLNSGSSWIQVTGP